MNHEKHEKTRKRKATTGHTQPSPKTMAGTADNTEVGFDGLVGLFEQTQTAMQTQAARSVDIALVVRNWLFGWYIVEYQQHGSDRASYGKKLLKKLSEQLTKRIGKGFSVDNLELMRKFYAGYAGIQQTLPVTTLPLSISEILFRISSEISDDCSVVM